MTTKMLKEEADLAYWEERIQRMTQMSQDIDDGLYDDVLNPRREAGIRLITDQLPDGYAYDHDESQIVRFDPDLPNTFMIKGEAGNDLDAENGLYDNLIDPLSENAIRLITDQLPDGYAYDHRESQIVRFDADLPDTITIRYNGTHDRPEPVPIVVHPTEAEADPERYETRT